MIIVAVSGGFDPVHIGHVRMFEEAKKLGDQLIVIINNDNWLLNKKGHIFMPESERLEIIRSLDVVDFAILSLHPKVVTDTSVSRELYSVRPTIFANGGDRKEENTPEDKTCDELGITMIFNVGGHKIQSSSELVNKYKYKE